MPGQLPTDPDELLDYRRIGEIFGVTPRTAQRWDHLGLLPRPAFRVKKVRRWTWRQIRAWKDLGGAPGSDENENDNGGQKPPKK